MFCFSESSLTSLEVRQVISGNRDFMIQSIQYPSSIRL